MRELGKLIRHHAFNHQTPFFSVIERGAHKTPETRELTLHIVNQMIKEGKFYMPKMDIQLRNQLSEVEIQLVLNEEHAYPISGFPRCMHEDGTEDKTSLRPLPTNTRRWAGRSNSTNAQRRKIWQPPDRAQFCLERKMLDEADPDYYANSLNLVSEVSGTGPPLHDVNSISSASMPLTSETDHPGIPEIHGKEVLLHDVKSTSAASTLPISEVDHNFICEIDGKELPIPSPQEMGSSQQPSIPVAPMEPARIRPTPHDQPAPQHQSVPQDQPAPQAQAAPPQRQSVPQDQPATQAHPTPQAQPAPQSQYTLSWGVSTTLLLSLLLWISLVWHTLD